MKNKLILFTLLICLCITTAFASEIDKKIYEELKSKGEVSVIIKLKDTDNSINDISNSNYEQRLISEKDRIHEQQERFLEDIEKRNTKFSLQTQEKLLKIERRYSALNFISAKISYDGIERLKDNPFVEKVYYNEIRKIFLDNSNPKIDATLVLGLIYNSTNITGKYESICVIDTGVDYGHPNLGNCTNTTFLAGNCSRIIAGYDNVNNDYDPIDDHGHGTHVAGIIISNDSTYKGIAPDTSIVALKSCNSGGSCSDQDITDSIDWCINNKTRYNISIISMSLGGGSYSSNCDGTSAPVDSANNAANLGFFVAVASGNDGSTNAISSPACASNVTAVGGINTDDASMIYNRAPFISIIAPAVSITSTVPKSGGTHNSATGFKALSGTSMATPHVSATAALILQYKKLEQGRNLTFQQIEDAMNTTGKSINESGTIYRRINTYKALLSLDNTTPTITFTFPTPTNATNTTNSSILINISANEVLSIAILEFNSTNTTMNGSTMSWFFNKTTLNNGVFNYRVFGNDSAGNMGISEVRSIQINNTAPNITTTYPNYTLVNISEPNNQTFNITYTDIDGDSLTIAWYQNNSVVSNSNNYTFIGNYTNNGVYNITVIISDSALESKQEWILTVNNTNRAPLISNLTLSSTDTLNRTNGTLIANWTHSDLDIENITANESAWFNNTVIVSELANLTTISYTNTTKNQNWTFSVRVFDGMNWSNWLNATITIKNAIPELVPISNFTISETDWINISVNATDIDNDTLNYTINFTRFTQNKNNFSWLTNTSDSGVYLISITINDSTDIISQNITLTIINMVDSDNDGIIDSYDEDDDNDNINDSVDFLTGNSSVINSSIPLSINITINFTANFSNIFNGTLLVNITNNTKPLIEFNWTFNETNRLNLYNLTINLQSDNITGWIEVRGLKLNMASKILYLDKLNASYNSVCIKDIENASVSNISQRCNSANESVLVCDGTTSSGYSCFNLSTQYKILGLSHSAIIERCKDNDGDGYGIGCNKGSDCNDNDANKNTDCTEQSQGNSGSSGGGGGGGGGSGNSQPTNSVTYFFNTITKDEFKITQIKKDFLPIKKLGIKPNKFLDRVSITITLLDDKPNNISKPNRNVYQYLEIKKENIEDKDIERLEMEFEVNLSWLKDNNQDEKSVRLLRAVENSFIELPTELISIGEKIAHYSSESNGLSYFAISSKENVKEKNLLVDSKKLNDSFTNNSFTGIHPTILMDKINASLNNSQLSSPKSSDKRTMQVILLLVFLGIFLLVVSKLKRKNAKI